jgi:cardiolipin synthase
MASEFAWSPYLTAAVIVLDIVAIVRALWRGHGVEGTLAWILAILAFPGLGAVLYFALSGPSIKRTTRRMRQATLAARDTLARQGFEALPADAAFRVHEPTTPVLELAASLSGVRPTRGNCVALLCEDEGTFRRIEQLVEHARQHVWAEYYIIRNDETGSRFLDLLAAKAAAGVEVRLLYDAFGSLGLDARRLAALRRAGGLTESFLPVNPLRRRWSVHLRNHRKLVIIDGEVGFTGGMNIGDEYSGRARRRGAQHYIDTHLELRGPAVADMAQIFIEDWAFATDEVLEPPNCAVPLGGGNSIVALVESGPDQQYNAHRMVYFTGIAAAAQSVYLTTPYFIPDELTIQALVSAALRGVDVRLLLPARNDVWVVGAAARSHYRELVAAGVRVFEYLPAMLHGKWMVVDGQWGIVGSANVDMRSFRLNFELGAVVYDPEFAAELQRRFVKDLESSREITWSMVQSRSRLGRLGDNVARLLSPLL